MSKHVQWYFDFISPYAYLQTLRFQEVADVATITCKPILFAGLLKHWETKGPAELASKRLFTYRYVYWYARRNGLDFRMPPAHPFNPLPALRLAVAADSSYHVIKQIFDFIWADGRATDEMEHWDALCAKVGIEPAQLASDAVKQGVRDNTEQAIAHGVFGVPTFAVDEQWFWGLDATDMLLDYLRDPVAFNDAEMQRIDQLPIAAARREASG